MKRVAAALAVPVIVRSGMLYTNNFHLVLNGLLLERTSSSLRYYAYVLRLSFFPRRDGIALGLSYRLDGNKGGKGATFQGSIEEIADAILKATPIEALPGPSQRIFSIEDLHRRLGPPSGDSHPSTTLDAAAAAIICGGSMDVEPALRWALEQHRLHEERYPKPSKRPSHVADDINALLDVLPLGRPATIAHLRKTAYDNAVHLGFHPAPGSDCRDPP